MGLVGLYGLLAPAYGLVPVGLYGLLAPWGSGLIAPPAPGDMGSGEVAGLVGLWVDGEGGGGRGGTVGRERARGGSFS